VVIAETKLGNTDIAFLEIMDLMKGAAMNMFIDELDKE
jgi:hypothetical protein